MPFIQKFPVGFELSTNSPIDSRSVVADITSPEDVWLATAYVGLVFFDEATNKLLKVDATDGTLGGLVVSDIVGAKTESDGRTKSLLQVAQLRQSSEFTAPLVGDSNIANTFTMMPLASDMKGFNGSDSDALWSGSEEEDSYVTLGVGIYKLSWTIRVTGSNGVVSFSSDVVNFDTKATLTGKVLNWSDTYFHDNFQGSSFDALIELTEETKVAISLVPDNSTVGAQSAVRIRNLVITEQPTDFTTAAPVDFIELKDNGSPYNSGKVKSLKDANGLVLTSRYRQLNALGAGIWICTDISAGTHGEWEKLLVGSEITTGNVQRLTLNQTVSTAPSALALQGAYDHATAHRMFPPADLFKGLYGTVPADIITGANALDSYITLQPGVYSISYRLHVQAQTGLVAFTADIMDFDTRESLTGKAPSTTDHLTRGSYGSSFHSTKFVLTEETNVCIAINRAIITVDTGITMEIQDLTLQQEDISVATSATMIPTELSGPETPVQSPLVTALKTAGDLHADVRYRQTGVSGTGWWICTEPAVGPNGAWEKLLTEGEIARGSRLIISQFTPTGGLNFDFRNDNTDPSNYLLIAPREDILIIHSGPEGHDYDFGGASNGQGNGITLPPGTFEISYRLGHRSIDTMLGFTNDIVNLNTQASLTGKVLADQSILVENGGGGTTFCKSIITLTEATPITIAMIPDASTNDSSVRVEVQDMLIKEVVTETVILPRTKLLDLKGPTPPDEDDVVSSLKGNGLLTVETRYYQTGVVGSGLWICIDPEAGTHGKWDKLITASQMSTEGLLASQKVEYPTNTPTINSDTSAVKFDAPELTVAKSGRYLLNFMLTIMNTAATERSARLAYRRNDVEGSLNNLAGTVKFETNDSNSWLDLGSVSGSAIYDLEEGDVISIWCEYHGLGTRINQPQFDRDPTSFLSIQEVPSSVYINEGAKTFNVSDKVDDLVLNGMNSKGKFLRANISVTINEDTALAIGHVWTVKNTGLSDLTITDAPGIAPADGSGKIIPVNTIAKILMVSATEYEVLLNTL